MVNKLTLTIILVVVLICFVACTKQPSGIILSPSTEPSTSDPTETTEPSAQSRWNKVSDNIYDITELTDNIKSLVIFDVDLEQRFIMCRDKALNEIHFIPFELGELLANYDEDYIVTTPWTSKYSIYQGNLYVHESSYSGLQTVQVHSPAKKQMLSQFNLPHTSVVGIAKGKDDVLLVDVSEDSQRIYTKNTTNNTIQELFTWDTSDKTKVPTITMLSQGDMGFAFTGWIYPSPNTQSVTCYGLIDNYGNLVEFTTQDSFEVEFFHGGMIIYDAIPIYGSTSTQTGKYSVYNAEKLSTVKITPDSVGETAARRIHVSETGKYFLTGGDCANGVSFRVYETQSGEVIAKFDSMCEIKDPVQQITAISEKEKAFIVVTRTKTEQQIHYYQF